MYESVAEEGDAMWAASASSGRRRARHPAGEQGEGVMSRVGLLKSKIPANQTPTEADIDDDDDDDVDEDDDDDDNDDDGDDSATESECEGPSKHASMASISPTPPIPTKTVKRKLESKSRVAAPEELKSNTNGRLADYNVEPQAMVEQSANNRKAMLKELASQLHSECVVNCQQLLILQKQWKEELEGSTPATIEYKELVDFQRNIHKDMAISKEPEIKSGVAVASQNRPSNCPTIRGVLSLENPPEANKVLLRRRMKWHANEREALRRGLLCFGLGRSEKVRSVMRSLLKRMRHGLGDIADCCWEFVRVCKLYADPKEQTFANECLIKAKSLDIETGRDLSVRVGQWERVEKSSSAWLRRLHLLQRLGEAVRISANKQTRDAAYRSIESLKDATIPFSWWGREADLALLSGVYKHGFGNYETLHCDPQFSEAFKPTDVEDTCSGSMTFFPKSEANMKEKYGQHLDEMELEKRSSTIKAKDGVGAESKRESQSVQVSNSGADGFVNRDDTLDDPYWPDSNTLTRRLKRLVNHICSAGEQLVECDVVKIEQKHTWSKRQKLELVKLLLMWGLPLVPGKAGKIDWQFVKDRTTSPSIKNRKDSILEACYFDLIKEMRQLLDGSQVLEENTSDDIAESEEFKIRKNGGEAKNVDFPRKAKYSVLTQKSALKLKERLELFETFRQAAEFLEEGWNQLGPKLNNCNGLPSWWQPDFHDEKLVKGVFRHGFGNWDQIFEDASLGFRGVDKAAMSGASLRKLLIKRLKLIASCLCRQLRKPRRKKLLCENYTMEAKEPKRFKYTRPMEVPRGNGGE